MKTNELVQMVSGKELTVAIPISLDNVVGKSPTVGITHVFEGFDWDSGTVFLVPDKQLTLDFGARKQIYKEEILSTKRLMDSGRGVIYKNSWNRNFEKLKSKVEDMNMDNLSERQLEDILKIIKQTEETEG